jgi:hypothetical protein
VDAPSPDAQECIAPNSEPLHTLGLQIIFAHVRRTVGELSHQLVKKISTSLLIVTVARLLL